MTLWEWFATQQALTVGVWYLATGFVMSIVVSIIFEVLKRRDQQIARIAADKRNRERIGLFERTAAQMNGDKKPDVSAL